MKTKYQQPYSIRPPEWMNEVQKDKYIEYEHHRQKYEAIKSRREDENG